MRQNATEEEDTGFLIQFELSGLGGFLEATLDFTGCDFHERRPAIGTGVRRFATQQITEEFSNRLGGKHSPRADGSATSPRPGK